ncbi:MULTISPECIES: hypothetical protein [Rubinisphaera]|uniref:Uncharacterized protein n=1 Tax=Rubinisphaera italica TaxID=2527969 RepID=A0A5C5XMY5_9PLAN|nr:MULTISPECIES: hypothetical protein [Rubinisphaera]MBV08909.1 hypothetical protein [Rubinisphaera sp.]TWT63455.1 hypothetical protein Pan54_42080 [Rubinisphaera italica]HCS55026.1 hypothetical protein [Planctomycetaceae bacterium]|tara:strand:+ start:1547 stop:1852 length:306 start_codon:yes stop_codon:yes gene_type:complete
MFGLIIGAGILGIVIAAMEDWDFPGWFTSGICVLSALVPAAIVNAIIGPEFFFVGLAVGAAVAGLVISAMCGMSFQRAYTAAAIYLGIHIALVFMIQLMMS